MTWSCVKHANRHAGEARPRPSTLTHFTPPPLYPACLRRVWWKPHPLIHRGGFPAGGAPLRRLLPLTRFGSDQEVEGSRPVAVLEEEGPPPVAAPEEDGTPTMALFHGVW